MLPSTNIYRNIQMREMGIPLQKKKVTNKIIEQNIAKNRFSSFEISLKKGEKVLERAGRFISTYISPTKRVSIYDLVARKVLWECDVKLFESDCCRRDSFKSFITDLGNFFVIQSSPIVAKGNIFHYYNKGKKVYTSDENRYISTSSIPKTHQIVCVAKKKFIEFDIIHLTNGTYETIKTELESSYSTRALCNKIFFVLLVSSPKVQRVLTFEYETKRKHIWTLSEEEEKLDRLAMFLEKKSLFVVKNFYNKDSLVRHSKLEEFNLLTGDIINELQIDEEIRGETFVIAKNNRYISFVVETSREPYMPTYDAHVCVLDRKSWKKIKTILITDFSVYSTPKIIFSGNMLIFTFRGNRIGTFDFDNVVKVVIDLTKKEDCKITTNYDVEYGTLTFDKEFLVIDGPKHKTIYIEDYLDLTK